MGKWMSRPWLKARIIGTLHKNAEKFTLSDSSQYRDALWCFFRGLKNHTVFHFSTNLQILQIIMYKTNRTVFKESGKKLLYKNHTIWLYWPSMCKHISRNSSPLLSLLSMYIHSLVHLFIHPFIQDIHFLMKSL